MLPIFAQNDSIHAGWLALIVPASTMLGLFGAWLLKVWQQWRESKTEQGQRQRQEHREDEDRTIEGQEKLIARLDGERHAQDRRIDVLTEQLTNERIMSARMLVWIRHIEELSRNNGIKFRPWDEIVKDTASMHVSDISDSGEFDSTGATP
jgi:hypothetical protein